MLLCPPTNPYFVFSVLEQQIKYIQFIGAGGIVVTPAEGMGTKGYNVMLHTLGAHKELTAAVARTDQKARLLQSTFCF